MAHVAWHKLYTSTVAAPVEVLFDLLSDMPNYGRWLPPSGQFGRTTDVDPYPVRLGSRYRDGKPGEEDGRSWWGSVTGFRPPGSIDFHHTINVQQLRAEVDVHIHYSFEPADGNPGHTALGRWLLLDISLPAVFRPLRGLITRPFDEENVRTLAAVKAFAESKSDNAQSGVASPPS
jgi:hypothetical protein